MYELKLYLRGGAVINCHVPGARLELSHDEQHVVKLDLSRAELDDDFDLRFLDLTEVAAIAAREIAFLPEILAPN